MSRDLALAGDLEQVEAPRPALQIPELPVERQVEHLGVLDEGAVRVQNAGLELYGLARDETQFGRRDFDGGGLAGILLAGGERGGRREGEGETERPDLHHATP